MTALAGLAGGMTIAGLATLLLELTRPAPRRGTPSRRRVVISKNARQRMLIALAAGLTTLAVTRWPVAMAAAMLAVLCLPQLISSRAPQRRLAVLEGLEQWTRRLSDMLMASRGIEDALEVSARHAPDAIAPAVAALCRRLAARNGSEAALRAFAAEVADPAGDRIAAALIIATGRRGGAISDVLKSLAAMLARDVAARREIEADQAQHRATVKWLTLFAVSFAAFAVVNRTYSAPFGTLAGQAVMAAVVALYIAGLGWLYHLGSVPAPGRFLAPLADVPASAVVLTVIAPPAGGRRARSSAHRDNGAHAARHADGRKRRQR